jgi:MFS family permease
MYQVANSRAFTSAGRALLRGRTAGGIHRTVLLLGLTSMFTDVSSEMVASILPFYLVFSLGLSPLQYGVVDGIQQGASSLVRVVAGFTADRFARYKEVATVGYALSAASRLLVPLVGRSWGLIAAVVFIDRTGKGIRTAPRDALISLSTEPSHLGVAFGVHRAMDTAGAIAGPLIAFALLALIPNGFDTVFLVSFSFALVGLAILVLFVENHVPAERAADAPLAVRDVARLRHVGGFMHLLVAAGALALVTISDGFIYLGLQENLGFAPRNLPLLFVATAAVFMVFAVPVGRLADRVGRGRVFVLGYALLLVVYAALLFPLPGLAGTVLVLAAFGLFYAATDGVLAALASQVLPADLRATGLALLVTVTSIARLVASVLFGAAWTVAGVDAAVVIFGIALAVAMVAAAAVLRSAGAYAHA